MLCVWWHFGCGILRLSPPLSRSKQVVVVDCFEAIKRGGVHVSEPSVVFLWFGMCVCVCGDIAVRHFVSTFFCIWCMVSILLRFFVVELCSGLLL